MALSTSEIKVKNLLSTYDTLTLTQLEILGGLNTVQQKNIISSLVAKKAIKIVPLGEGVEGYCSFFSEPSRKFALVGEALKELTQDSKLPILWFDKQEYPFTAVAFISNKMFDIAVIDKGDEVAFNAVANRVISVETGTEKDGFSSAPAPRENLLIIAESAEQLEKIKIKHNNIVFANVDLKNASVTFNK